MSIEHHPTFNIIDSSKLQQYTRCPRKTFFSHILGWTPIAPSIHLVHGEAWHRMMEYVYKTNFAEDSLESGIVLYTHYYRQFFNQTADIDNDPKAPGVSYNALHSYIEEYKEHDQANYEVLYTEIAGSVLIGKKLSGDDRFIHFRLDTALYNKQLRKYETLEHKTGSRNSLAWRDGWIQKIQTGTYTHVLNCIFKPSEVYGVRINGTFFYKSQPPVNIRIPIRRTPLQMQEWLYTANLIADEYERDLDRLGDCKEKDDIMKAFPKRTESCTDFGTRCPFFDICMASQNPLRLANEQPPNEYKREYWDPRSREVDAENVFRDGKVVKKEG